MDKYIITEESKISWNQAQANLQAVMGVMYKNGIRTNSSEGIEAVKYDYKQMFKLFTQAAEQGHADAQNNLGLIYRDGKETPTVVYMVLDDIERREDEPTTQEYKELFTDYGLECPESLDFLNIAKSLSEKKGIDYDKAIECFTKAVSNGSDDAQVHLENMLNS